MVISREEGVHFLNRLYCGSELVYRLTAKTGVIVRVAGNGERQPAGIGARPVLSSVDFFKPVRELPGLGPAGFDKQVQNLQQPIEAF